jgi:hypothetical protein
MYDVIRTFGADYILFDLIFIILFLFLLIKNKKKIPLLAFFVGGLFINFLIDYGIWLHTGVREVFLPFNFFGAVFLFFFWFSLSYGVEYAYVFLMFEKKSNKILWTSLVLFGWLSVAFLSQLISINNSSITVIRHMSDLRILRIILVLIGYSLLFILKYDWKKISYLFLIGFIIHFMMEFSLLVSGIRPGSFLILLENSLIEFNMGVPFFYILYDKFLKKKIK